MSKAKVGVIGGSGLYKMEGMTGVEKQGIMFFITQNKKETHKWETLT